MFKPTNSSVVERLKQMEYIKKKIRKTFSYFDLQNRGYVLREEVRSVMRYLGQFPSEAQYVNIILPEIQEDEPPNVVKFEKFESYMLKVIIDNEYEPDDAERLLAAFRLLDENKRGYIEADTMRTILMEKGIKFFEAEWDSFEQYAKDPETNTINYEDYVANLIQENEEHMEKLMKGYEKFANL
jgi:calmodulin